MSIASRKRRLGAGNARRQYADDCDDVQYVATGCDVTSAGSGKRAGYCDCTTAWPAPSQDLVHRTNLIWQTASPDELCSSPTATTANSLSKTIYCRHASSGRTATSPFKSGGANTPDLFVDACRPEGPVTSSCNMATDAATSGHRAGVKTSTHLYESPVFSHLDRLLH